MKVRVLIEVLSAQDQDAEVMVLGFDGGGYRRIDEYEVSPMRRFTDRPALWGEWDRDEEPYFGTRTEDVVAGVILHGEVPEE